MLVHRRVTPSIKFASTHLYTWVERGTVKVKCLAQEHNTMSQPGVKPRLLGPQSSALTMRPIFPLWKSTFSVLCSDEKADFMIHSCNQSILWPCLECDMYFPYGVACWKRALAKIHVGVTLLKCGTWSEWGVLIRRRFLHWFIMVHAYNIQVHDSKQMMNILVDADNGHCRVISKIRVKWLAWKSTWSRKQKFLVL